MVTSWSRYPAHDAASAHAEEVPRHVAAAAAAAAANLIHERSVQLNSTPLAAPPTTCIFPAGHLPCRLHGEEARILSGRRSGVAGIICAQA